MVYRYYSFGMYKKTAKSRARKLLKDNNYMPSLNTVSEKGGGSQWSNKKPQPTKKLTKAEKKEQKRLKDTERSDTLFGKRFR